MTSEVLILNRRAVIIAADSAITSSTGKGQPRYSKAATKIFDLSESGGVAAAFFGNALIDLIPWELAIKSFRKHLGKQTFSTSGEYLGAFLTYLSGNSTLYPPTLLQSWVQSQFDNALMEVVEFAKNSAPSIIDVALPLADRQALWSTQATHIENLLIQTGILPCLSQTKLDAVTADPAWTARASAQLAVSVGLEAIDAAELARLAHLFRYVKPDLLLSDSGLIATGYGNDEIFPSYRHVDVFGHVGDELAYREVRTYSVSHASTGMIQPLAQSSMIDVFTDGFGNSLEEIIRRKSFDAMQGLVDDLRATGCVIQPGAEQPLLNTRHEAFMSEWKRENWANNFTPLLQVISTLEVQEMAHLAETLLTLESLKERVTLPSESVGGPIDVAAITKSDGLVWIKRKHYFDAALNMRYAQRLSSTYTP